MKYGIELAIAAAAAMVGATAPALAADPASRTLYFLPEIHGSEAADASQATFVYDGRLPFNQRQDVLPLACTDRGALCDRIQATNIDPSGNYPNVQVIYPTHSTFSSYPGKAISDYDAIYSYADTEGTALTFVHEGYLTALGDGASPLRLVGCSFFTDNPQACTGANLSIVNGLAQFEPFYQSGSDRSVKLPVALLATDGRYTIKATGTAPAAQLTIVGALATRPAVTVTPAVPEPATWATMLAGLGAAGLALRRRRPRVRSA